MLRVLAVTLLPMCLGLNTFVPSPLNQNFNKIPMSDLEPALKSNQPLVKHADVCDPKKCGLPDCFCSGWAIPGGLKQSQVPQMVVLTFQNAVNNLNYERYVKLFHNRMNPNGCPRTGSFYVSHNYTNYWQVQSLFSKRHEIAVNSVSSPRPPLPKDQWYAQIQSEKDILAKWAQVPSGEIRGFRAPYLTPGGDDMIDAMQKSKLSVDSSRTTVRFMNSPFLMWPYTYDYSSTQDCVVAECPVESHKGVWEMPLVAWKDKNGDLRPSPYACEVDSKEEAFDLLVNKFIAHHNSSNRAPLVIILDSAWLVNDDSFEATQLFLDYLDYFKDTYTVSSWQAIQWIQHPAKLDNIKNFKPWQCNSKPPSVCDAKKASVCQFDASRKLVKPGKGTPVYNIVTCERNCPQCYPWIGDAAGKRC
ncbi:hypothetical protein CAPTEDRAFT_161915 [Capitella teleta]|uniref:NodB homology domain-containing protein n=1 Tax=Capitella teleta TaxID=283909 RepID=R7U0Y6_CAPTE|nr:hypothetical protein CAPTEDRAFT_161915 [Capitella teleta]|eukprot:ELT99863.1 hypothetical protein CAPTEDRAFT_161915 [Capitella teleta]